MQTARCLRALVVYITYRAHNILRRRHDIRGDIDGLLAGLLLRAVHGHPGAERLTRLPWTTPHAVEVAAETELEED